MKVLIINGSPRANGNTSVALEEMKKIFLEGRIKNTNDPVYSNVAFLQSINFENER